MKQCVAPHAGAWIEMDTTYKAFFGLYHVAPHAGAWIEMGDTWDLIAYKASHPMRVRGLKSLPCRPPCHPPAVAPHAGAWIEIQYKRKFFNRNTGRTPCGCVD